MAKPTKKTTSKKEVKRKPTKREIEKFLAVAEEIYDGDKKGIVLIMEVSEEEKGLKCEGVCRVNKVTPEIMNRVVMEALQIDPMNLALHSLLHK